MNGQTKRKRPKVPENQKKTKKPRKGKKTKNQKQTITNDKTLITTKLEQKEQEGKP